MIAVALAVVIATSVGIGCEHRFATAPQLARRALALMLYVLLPFISYVNIAHLRVTLAGGAGLGFAYVAVAVVGLIAWRVGRSRLHLSDRRLGAVICSVIVVNTGYLGFPMVVALLGTGALPSGIAYDQLVSGPSVFLIAFAVGAALGDAGGDDPRARARGFVTRNPPLLAVIAGLLVPSSLAPNPLPAISHVVVYGLLLLGFFAVGIYLSSERRADGAALLERPDAPVLLALGLRVVVAPLIVLGLSTLIVRVPHAYLLDAAMPTGINSLIVGHAYGLDQRLIATIIVWSTAAVLVVGLVASAL